MCGLPFEAMQRQRMLELAAHTARMRAQRQRWDRSATPYQDEVARQLRETAERKRDRFKVLERRRFYCAGMSWEATILVDRPPHEA